MDYSDSDNDFQFYSDSQNEDYHHRPNKPVQKCRTCGHSKFDNMNGSLIWRICKTMNTFSNNVRVDFETMMQAKKWRNRVKKVKGKVSEQETPLSFLKTSRFQSQAPLGDHDWTRQIFNNISPEVKQPKDNVREIKEPDNWVDYFLSLYYGITVWAKQMRESFSLNLTFEKSVKNIYLKYLSWWKQKSIIGSFTNERRGGLQLDKRKRVKRFEFFTQNQLEDFTEEMKTNSEIDRVFKESKENLQELKQVYYDIRYEKDVHLNKRKRKGLKSDILSSFEILKRNTVCYNDQLYDKFQCPNDVFWVDKYPELPIIERAMIYIHKKYPMESLIEDFKIDPVKLLRSIKYKNGKMLNIEDRTYSIQVLAEMVEEIYKKMEVESDLRLYKFLSSKIKKKEKLVLLIFTLDMSFNDYLTDCKNSQIIKSFKKWLKLKIRESLQKEYLGLEPDESMKDDIEILAKKEAKKMSLEKWLSKYLSYHFDSLEILGKSFKEQINDIKKSKYDNQKNKLTSFEPNTILNFLILGYFDYQVINQDSEVFSVNDIIDAINQNQINYLNYGDKFIKSINNSNMQVKHISNPLLVCRNLRYLLPSRLNSGLKEYLINLCTKTCENLNISGSFQKLVLKYIHSQWNLFWKQTSFPFNAHELIMDSIHRVYNLVYLGGLTMKELNSLPLYSEEENINVEFLWKQEFDQKFCEGSYQTGKERHQKSLPWEIKNYEYCEVETISGILDSATNHFVPSSKEEDQEKNELADIFEEIMNFSDDEDFEEEIPVEKEQSENSSIMSSDEEEGSVKSRWKIYEIEISVS